MRFKFTNIEDDRLDEVFDYLKKFIRSNDLSVKNLNMYIHFLKDGIPVELADSLGDQYILKIDCSEKIKMLVPSDYAEVRMRPLDELMLIEEEREDERQSIELDLNKVYQLQCAKEKAAELNKMYKFKCMIE